jgi:uncharacterized membrane protein HdeD (DUF308 family)
MVMTLARNWWALALRGLCAIAFGVLAFIWPGITLGALVLLFGAYALVDGILSIASAIFKSEVSGMPWWALVLVGLMGIAAGVVTFAWPGITALVLLYLIAAWAIVSGIFEIIAAVRLRTEIENEWWLALTGIISVIFGLMLMARPGAGAIAVVWLIGSYAIILGIFLLALAFKLKGFRERLSGRFASAA